ncbi:(2Fe-2S)-binding protein [Sphingomonas sp.]|uniref:(2Fe-2S)-binding protein n=1 Tax=Sphingomonas sp. TaxID=28214 RepID=UPI003B3BD804
MTRRIEEGVARGMKLSLLVDGRRIEMFAGETVATAMLAAGITAFRTDTGGRPRGLFCNMGTCSECYVRLQAAGKAARRVRACVTPVEDNMVIETGGADFAGL